MNQANTFFVIFTDISGDKDTVDIRYESNN